MVAAAAWLLRELDIAYQCAIVCLGRVAHHACGFAQIIATWHAGQRRLLRSAWSSLFRMASLCCIHLANWHGIRQLHILRTERHGDG
jgi:uracil-DNA glycosylase